MKHWISAFRLRTLPLALSSILLGGLMALAHDRFNGAVVGLAALTTLLLQVLSNLANDYGDSVHGADRAERQGPQRAVQAGHISKRQMKRAVFITAVLAFISGLWLLWEAFGKEGLYYFLGFVLLGLAAIWAAISYTAGKKPYGYAGLGDLFVLLFFGPVGVLGTYYLQAHQLPQHLWLPALSCGLLATGVLNVNNLRDISSDALAGKRSLPVRLGPERGRVYHWALLLGGIACALLYVALHFNSPWQLLFLLVVPFLIRHGLQVQKRKEAASLDPLLKQLALLTLLFVVLFGLGHVLVV